MLRVCTYKNRVTFFSRAVFSPPAECFPRIAVVYGMYIYYAHAITTTLGFFLRVNSSVSLTVSCFQWLQWLQWVVTFSQVVWLIGC